MLDFIHERWFRMYLMIIAAVALLAVVILLIVGAASRPSVPEPLAVEAKPLKFSDFLIEDPVPLDRPDWQLRRPPRPKWEPEEVEQFWVDPVEMGIKALGEENDKMVEDFFDSIP